MQNIYQNGIFILYQNGIILSKGFLIRLKEIRRQRNITQLKLALDLNISQNTISRYETREREADYDTLIRIADYFGVSIDYLLERTDDPTFHKGTK